jgi:hypothetical protein
MAKAPHYVFNTNIDIVFARSKLETALYRFDCAKSNAEDCTALSSTLIGKYALQYKVSKYCFNINSNTFNVT